MVHIHVSALRKVLPAGVLQTRAARLRARRRPAEAIDLVRFERLQRRGPRGARRRRRRRRPRRGCARRWRCGAARRWPSSPSRSRASRPRTCEERHRVCLEDRIDADLALGRHADLVGRARGARRAATRCASGCAAQLMLALYRSGRQADALAPTGLPRRRSTSELGLEPSPRMRELEGRILRQDAALDGRRRTSDFDAAPRDGPDPLRRRAVGGYSIAYQVVGDGPLDIVFVHGWVCSFQAGWEWPALASFYRRLAGFGRLILFDKRGTGPLGPRARDRVASRSAWTTCAP